MSAESGSTEQSCKRKAAADALSEEVMGLFLYEKLVQRSLQLSRAELEDSPAHRYEPSSFRCLAVWNEDQPVLPVEILNAHPVKFTLVSHSGIAHEDENRERLKNFLIAEAVNKDQGYGERPKDLTGAFDSPLRPLWARFPELTNVTRFLISVSRESETAG